MMTSRFKYTKEEIFKVAEKYTTYHEFVTKERKLYRSAEGQGLLPELKQKLKLRKVVKDLSFEEMKEIALKYERRVDLEAGEPGIYKIACEQGFIKELCDHMPIIKHDRYTDEELIAEAKKYKSPAEFQFHNRKLYNAAKERKLFKDLYNTEKTTFTGWSTGEETLRNFLETILNFKFIKKRFIPYLAPGSKTETFLELDGINFEHNIAFEHQGEQHFKEIYRNESTNDIKAKDLHKVEYCIKNQIKLLVIPDLVGILKYNESLIKETIKSELERLNIVIPHFFYTQPLKWIFVGNVKWTEDAIKVAAETCSSASDFYDKFPGAATKAYKLGMMESLFRDKGYKLPIRYTEQDLIEQTKEYKTLKDLLKNNRSLYQTIKKRGCLEKICKINDIEMNIDKKIGPLRQLSKRPKSIRHEQTSIRVALELIPQPMISTL